MPIAANHTLRTTDFADTSPASANKIPLTKASGEIDKSFIQSNLKFGGDGSNGALTITSGVTTIDLANAPVYVLNYTTISITGTGSLAFINPHDNGTVIIIKCQGNVTLTSSAAPMIDCSKLGAKGGATRSGSGSGSSGHTDGDAGLPGTSYAFSFQNTNAGGPGTSSFGNGVGGTIPIFATNEASYNSSLYPSYPNIWLAAGGATGYNTHSTPAWSFTAAAGGRGGGTLIMECAGAWNFTTTNGISVAGESPAASTSTGGVSSSIGGSGAGAGGLFLGFYNTLTANTGTVNKSGGTGGSGGSSGGGSGANAVRNGANGNSSAGGEGPTGVSLIAKNINRA